jgi:hypothetical protein
MSLIVSLLWNSVQFGCVILLRLFVYLRFTLELETEIFSLRLHRPWELGDITYILRKVRSCMK